MISSIATFLKDRRDESDWMDEYLVGTVALLTANEVQSNAIVLSQTLNKSNITVLAAFKPIADDESTRYNNLNRPDSQPL